MTESHAETPPPTDPPGVEIPADSPQPPDTRPRGMLLTGAVVMENRSMTIVTTSGAERSRLTVAVAPG